MTKPKATSKKVASKAAKILHDDKAGADEKAVAASALAQAEPEPKGNGIDEVEPLQAAPPPYDGPWFEHPQVVQYRADIDMLIAENERLREQLRWHQERAAK